MPQVNHQVEAIYVESTQADTEVRMIKALRNSFPGIPSDDSSLPEILRGLSHGEWQSGGKKILIVLDQFEQRLSQADDYSQSQLAKALRHCDGEHLQCLLLIRDDFWLALTRFVDALEMDLLEGQNSQAIDLFDRDHAKKVLIKLGQAYGCLPQDDTIELTRDQKTFLDRSIDQMSDGNYVICVRLTLFAEMFKSRPWTVAELKSVGGAAGVGEKFLEETFGKGSKTKRYEQQREAAKAVLGALLPDSGSDIRGSMKSVSELMRSAGFEKRRNKFNQLVKSLDQDLRLITRTDPDDVGQTTRGTKELVNQLDHYQLTHDYLIQSLRNWLQRKKRETRSGRAQLLLEERSLHWNEKPENRFLPSMYEWFAILVWTMRKTWNTSQRRMMGNASRLHGIQIAVSALLIALTIVAFTYVGRRNVIARTKTAVLALGNARGQLVRSAIEDLEKLPRNSVVAELNEQLALGDETRIRSLKYGTAHFDKPDIEFLISQIENAPSNEVDNIVDALCGSKTEVINRLKTKFASVNNLRLQARIALTALLLDETSLVAELCQFRANPIGRTVFINECSKWRGDLSDVPKLLIDDSAFRSSIILTLGLIGVQNLTPNEVSAWEQILLDSFMNCSDSPTHSAADWTLRQWKIPLPSAKDVSKPNNDWHVNSQGMTMLCMPKGSFLRLRDGENNEQKNNVQRVDISRQFWICSREVSVGDFQKFVNDPGCKNSHKPKDWNGPSSQRSPTSDHPIQSVNWRDAILFCNWLSRNDSKNEYYEINDEEIVVKGGNGYRLPTEAEWEYCCRAGSSTTFAHGNQEELIKFFAAISSHVTSPTGFKMPNTWGVFDMHGNVREWCNDWYHEYDEAAKIRDPTGHPDGKRKVSRGGAFFNQAENVGSAIRYSDNPATRNTLIGFRVARDFP